MFKKPETTKERRERKAQWLARATAHFDTPEIRKDAGEMFEKANPIERIVESAIMLMPSGRIYTGKRHCDCFARAWEAGEKPPKNEIQGFITSSGQFVARELAGLIAWQAGQTEKCHKQLYSEDVW